MIDRIFAIALNTFREAARRRVMYAVIAVVLGMNLFGLALGELSLDQGDRVAVDVGLAGVSFFGGVTAILLGVTLLYGEIQRRTIHTILAKPLHRFEFVLGKYAGMALTLGLLVIAFAATMGMALLLRGVSFDAAVAKAVLLGYLEVLVVAAVAVFFSSFSSPFLSGAFTAGVWFVGRVTPELRAAVAMDSPLLRVPARIALAVVPDIHLFVVSGQVVDGVHRSVHGSFVTWEYVALAAGYGLLQVAVLLLVAVAIFSRRDFV